MEMKGALTLPHNDLPDRRIKPSRITDESVIYCAGKVLAYNKDAKEIFCTKADIDEAQVRSWSLISLIELGMKFKN